MVVEEVPTPVLHPPVPVLQGRVEHGTLLHADLAERVASLGHGEADTEGEPRLPQLGWPHEETHALGDESGHSPLHRG